MENAAPEQTSSYTLADLPVGFNTFSANGTSILVAKSLEELRRENPNLSTIFSLPVALYVNERGHTVMNWYSPRTNCGWPVVILEDCSASFPDVRHFSHDEIEQLQKEGRSPEQQKLGRDVGISDNARFLEAIEEYQCSGCMNGINTKKCDRFRGPQTKGCGTHYAGTMMRGYGVMALGLPRGFTRFGPSETRNIPVFENMEALFSYDSGYSAKTRAPVWMHLNEKGHTLIRWYDILEGDGHSTVVLADCRASLEGAVEITASDIEDMD